MTRNTMSWANKMLFLSRSQVRKLVDIEFVIEAVERAFIGARLKKIGRPDNFTIYIPEREGRLAVKPAWSIDHDLLGAKINSLFRSKNLNGDRTSISGAILLFDLTTGVLCAVIDSLLITAIRTGAATGVAARALSRPEASTVALIGTGLHAPSQLAAIC